MMNLTDVQQVLATHEPELITDETLVHAVVALLLKEDAAGLQLLFIERATHADDPWSGDIGFPGGKVDAADGSVQQTAEREVGEELGLDLRNARCLGRLSDVSGAHLPVRVSCLVYGLDKVAPVRLNHEIRDAFWVALKDLEDVSRHLQEEVTFRDETFMRQAFILPVPGKPVLWGLTYRLVMQFAEMMRGAGGA
jgi:8-oxo-dGTP pyrophosphatase MutT (NUDIX family)